MAFQPQGSFNYTHVSANGNGDALKSGSGILHSVTINTKGASANVLTLYDSLIHGTGTVIAVIDTTSQVQTLVFDAWFQTGLSYSLATGTAADVTLNWL
jgi:hypothetical protein